MKRNIFKFLNVFFCVMFVSLAMLSFTSSDLITFSCRANKPSILCLSLISCQSFDERVVARMLQLIWRHCKVAKCPITRLRGHVCFLHNNRSTNVLSLIGRQMRINWRQDGNFDNC